MGLYVLARLSKDPVLVEPLRRRADLHVLTASVRGGRGVEVGRNWADLKSNPLAG